MKKILAVAILMTGVCFAEDKPVYGSRHFALYRDHIQQGDALATAVSPTEIQSNYSPDGQTPAVPARWRLQTDISQYPEFRSDYPLIDALYNMSLEELSKDVRPDGTFMAGKEWEGVWTRDISYSILLSLAAIEPDIAKRSLMAKVKRDRIVQDTGTGGSWPVSSDRIVWALAAWELYQVTGDRDWLRRSYVIIRNSAEDDEHTVRSKSTSLFNGESSFLDWREQTYPRWMQPVDIYTAQALGTNAVHYRTYRILSAMARELGESPSHYDDIAESIRSAINRRLWNEKTGYYGQYLYGRNHLTLSPRSEALGEALSILFDIADEKKQDSILHSTPVMEYGVPCVYPQSVGIPPYHNNAVWPFVESFWTLAAAKRQNSALVLEGLASIYRSSALFLTNKENIVADTGSYKGTVINSDRQLWSVAGSLATIYRVLIGMEFGPQGIAFHPAVPSQLGGTKTLSNFHYRKATLTIRVHGFGTAIRSIAIDGQQSRPLIPADIEGPHDIEIWLSNTEPSQPARTLADAATAPDVPTVRAAEGSLVWDPVPGAATYRIYKDGELLTVTLEPSLPIDKGASEYQVSSLDAAGRESFLSEPVSVNLNRVVVEAETGARPTQGALSGFSGSGAVELDRERNTDLVLEAVVPTSGRFKVIFRYSNGSGPINTDNKCGIRTLFVDGKEVGPIVMPQRGVGSWSEWGDSSSQLVHLQTGKHTFALRFEPSNENMGAAANRVLLDSMQLIFLH